MTNKTYLIELILWKFFNNEGSKTILINQVKTCKSDWKQSSNIWKINPNSYLLSLYISLDPLPLTWALFMPSNSSPVAPRTAVCIIVSFLEEQRELYFECYHTNMPYELHSLQSHKKKQNLYFWISPALLVCTHHRSCGLV